MNLDDIKNEWDKDSNENIDLPDSVGLLRGEQSPLEKIRRNMKLELFFQVAGIIIMGSLPEIYNVGYPLKMMYYLLYILLCPLTIYFFIRFYFFYNKIGKMNFSTKESLYELYYGMLLNIETYKTFTYMLIPNALIFGMIIRFNQYYQYSLSAFSGYDILGFKFWTYLIFFVIFLGLIYFLTEWWVKRMYGRYVVQIEEVIEEMREGL